MEIKIYGSGRGDCHYCEVAKKFFEKHSVDFKFCDIYIEDAVKRIQYKKELKQHGDIIRARIDKIPFIVIDDTHRFVGFTDEIKKEISEILGIGIDE